jgi:hypothetical protein
MNMSEQSIYRFGDLPGDPFNPDPGMPGGGPDPTDIPDDGDLIIDPLEPDNPFGNWPKN